MAALSSPVRTDAVLTVVQVVVVGSEAQQSPMPDDSVDVAVSLSRPGPPAGRDVLVRGEAGVKPGEIPFPL